MLIDKLQFNYDRWFCIFCCCSLYDNMWDDGNSLGPKEVHSYLTRVMYNRRNKFNPLWNSLVLGGVKNGQKYLGTVNLNFPTFFLMMLCGKLSTFGDTTDLSLKLWILSRLVWLVYILRTIMWQLDLEIILHDQFFVMSGMRTWVLKMVLSYWRSACVCSYIEIGLLSTSFRCGAFFIWLASWFHVVHVAFNVLTD